jgi:hypothetical protein
LRCYRALFLPEIKPTTKMITTDYLVDMTVAASSTILTPEEGVAFAERYVLPTLDTLEGLQASGRIVAGGPLAGAMRFTFIARAESSQELEDVLASLSIWSRAQTTVSPLGSFKSRAGRVRQRLLSSREQANDGSSQLNDSDHSSSPRN